MCSDNLSSELQVQNTSPDYTRFIFPNDEGFFSVGWGKYICTGISLISSVTISSDTGTHIKISIKFCCVTILQKPNQGDEHKCFHFLKKASPIQ